MMTLRDIVESAKGLPDEILDMRIILDYPGYGPSSLAEITYGGGAIWMHSKNGTSLELGIDLERLKKPVKVQER